MLKTADARPVFLSCQVEEGALILAYTGAALPNGETLLVQLEAETETTVVITDFEHAGHQYRVNAFTQASDGSLTPWERTSEGVRSPTLRGISNQEMDMQVQVMSSAYAPSSSEVTARQLADFEQRAAYTPAAVKIRVPKPEDIKPGE